MRLSAEQVKAIKHESGYFSGARAAERLHSSLEKNQRGFTLVELITVIVIVGILAVAAVPRFFDKNVFDSRGFYDQVISTLRYAQKTAIAKHRFVCVTFPTNRSITLTYDTTPPGVAHTVAACGTNLPSLATGLPPYTVTSPTADVTLTGYANFYFDALGQPFPDQPGITVSGYAGTPIVVTAVTGYVH